MSNVRKEDIITAAGFGWMIRLPITVFQYVYGNIKSTISKDNKEKLKQIQKEAIDNAMKDILYSTKKCNPWNLELYYEKLVKGMIIHGFSYDHASLADYKNKISKVEKILKHHGKIYDKIDSIIFNKTFSRDKALYTLRGCCQDLSTILSLMLSSPLEKDKRHLIKHQSLLNQKEIDFLKTLPDKKVSLVFGNLVDSTTNDSQKHVIVCVEYDDNIIDKKKEKYIDVSMVLDEHLNPTRFLKENAMKDFVGVDFDYYNKKLKSKFNQEFKPTAKIELKNDVNIEKIYKDLYDTTRLYPETDVYKCKEIEK